MRNCLFCEYEEEDFELEYDAFKRGYWCANCDGYNYLLEQESRVHQFTLILEDKDAPLKSYDKPPVKLKKRLSPYRYPGGKSKVIDYLYWHLESKKTGVLISPFTGGGSFELAMLEAGVVDKIHMNDLDPGVFSFWWVLKHMPFELINRIEEKLPTHEEYFQAQQLIKNDYKHADLIEAAWASFLVNRLAYSGVFKANPLGGKFGTSNDLLQRWNPHDLVKRINKIHSMADQIKVTQLPAIELIEESYWNENATLFIDPPYVVKGKDLYHCYFTEDDHIELSQILDSLHMGFPGADVVVTYDYCELLNTLYRSPVRRVVGRVYSA